MESRTWEDFIAVWIIGLITLAITLFFGGCNVAHAEEVPEIAIKTIAMESAGESDYGMYLVASVIVNRARASNKSLESVCLAKWQFSCWNDKEWARRWLAKYYSNTVRNKAIKALNKAIKNPHPKITHYHTLKICPYWIKNMHLVTKIGNHLFYKK